MTKTMNVLLLGGRETAPLEAVVRAAGHTPIRPGDTRPAHGVIVSAAGTPGDWYAAGRCFAHGSEVCVFGTPTDAEVADMERVLTPAEAVAWLGTIPLRAPRGWRKTGLPASVPAAGR